MINIEKQKQHGIKQARKIIANIYKKKSEQGGKLTKDQQTEIARQQGVIDRWQRASKKGWKL